MSECPFLEKCAFFNDQLEHMPAVAENYKNDYCRGDYALCARYQVKEKTGKSHPSLLPNQTDMVRVAIHEMKQGYDR